jgi:predicted TIM-barrel fold metal-dependent hydrolase
MIIDCHCHAGKGDGLTGPWDTDAPLARHPNIYTDTSGVRRFDLLEQAVRRAGAKKILFGSDGPWLHPGVELSKVKALGLSAADENLILGGNFLRLIEHARTSTPAKSRAQTDRLHFNLSLGRRAQDDP